MIDGQAEHFKGRTISNVTDLSVEEQLYLYAKTKILKDAMRKQRTDQIDQFRIKCSDMNVYLLFMGESSRTKNSFLNAAKFHRVTVNDFDVAGSSFNKKESITDTVRMLAGYTTKQSVFIIRSPQEGTCAWLRTTLHDFAQKIGIPMPALINAGDGQHSHPTHEYFDQFSFLEQCKWNREHIHIALVGDLFHGRLAHSKADGLKIFRNVKVDLVAPPELQMPSHVVQQMKRQGFQVRVFMSLKEYMESDAKAWVWYFTTLHVERFGDKLKERQGAVKDAVTFRKEWTPRLPPGAKFYHRFPFHSDEKRNTVPPSLGDTPLNGWDAQALNAYHVRTMLLAMVGGQVGGDFTPFVEVVPVLAPVAKLPNPLGSPVQPQCSAGKQGIKPVEAGLVIDHIGVGQSVRDIWETISKVRKLIGLNVISSHGVYESTSREPGSYKGIISLPNHPDLSHTELRRLAAIAPECTLNIVEDNMVIVKYRLHMPPKIYNFKDIGCKNEVCISNPKHFENVNPCFVRVDDENNTFACVYCERVFRYQDIWHS